MRPEARHAKTDKLEPQGTSIAEMPPSLAGIGFHDSYFRLLASAPAMASCAPIPMLNALDMNSSAMRGFGM